MNNEYCLFGIVLNHIYLFEEMQKIGNVFFDSDIRKLYDIVNNLFLKKMLIDNKSVSNFIIENLQTYSLTKYNEIYEAEYDDYKFDYYLNIQLTKFYKERFKNIYHEVINNKYENYLDIKLKLEEFKREIKEPDFLHYADIKQICYNLVENLKDDKKIKKVFSAIDFIDNSQGGYDYTDYIILGASESVGKTSYIIDLMLKQLKNGMKVGFFSAEMDEVKILQLFASNLSGIDSNKVELNILTSDEKNTYMRALERIYEYADNIMIDGKNTEIQKIIQKAKVMKQQGCQVIYIDYLHMLEYYTEKRIDEYSELKIISREIKKSCKDLQIPHIVLACITKEGKKDAEPELYHIRGNGKIANDIDIGIIIKEIFDTVDGDSNKRILEFIVRKNRNGKRGRYRKEFIASIRRFNNIDF